MPSNSPAKYNPYNPIPPNPRAQLPPHQQQQQQQGHSHGDSRKLAPHELQQNRNNNNQQQRAAPHEAYPHLIPPHRSGIIILHYILRCIMLYHL